MSPLVGQCIETVYQCGTWYLGWVIAIISTSPPRMHVIYEDGDNDTAITWAIGTWRPAATVLPPSAAAEEALAEAFASQPVVPTKKRKSTHHHGL